MMRPSVNTAFTAPDPVDEVFDVTYACSLMNGDRLGLVTVSGGVGVLMAQEAEEVRSGRVVSCTEKAQGSSDLRGRAKPCGRDGALCERDRLA
jgi:acyl-CoA synthetase (NDP forming)